MSIAIQSNVENIDKCLVKKSLIKLTHPWRRYFARGVDIFLMGVIGYQLLGCIPIEMCSSLFNVLSNNSVLKGAFYVFSSVFLNSIFIAISGSTIGKLLFGIRLLDKNNHNLSFLLALRRELMIYVKGMALGIPILILFPQYFSYKNLMKTGEASWDKKLQCNVIYTNKNDDVFIGEWIVFRIIGLSLFLLWRLLYIA
ncbi:RDD family protein [Legionella feeleii]|uniref:RDD family n=1 Tax=Legionella feeleii TaxID=453 RepID=A0A378IS79_9GAMM|nr:RDD family protein [Legionella feeleii]STX37712.1 RDD family [Legionella feeleii]